MENFNLIYKNIETPKEEVLKNLLEKNEDELAKEIKKIKESGSTLGSGNYGQIKVLPDNSDYCVKIGKKNTHDKNNMLKEIYFLDEAKKHGVNVPSPRILVEEKDEAYLIMDTVNGLSLERLIEEDNLDLLPDNFNFIDFVTKTREEVKKLNEVIFHRDIKPNNIMIDNNGNPVIIDFGQSIFKKDLEINEHSTYSGDLKNLTKTLLMFKSFLKKTS